MFIDWGVTGGYPAVGDEKNYLMVAKSIVRDGDLSLTNNINPDRVWFDVPDAPAYDLHPFGLPLLISPGYYLGQDFGVRLELAMLSAFFSFIFFFYLNRSLTSTRWAVVLSLLLGVGFPFSVTATKIFPDLIGGLIVLFCLERAQSLSFSGRLEWSSVIVTALPLGYLPLLHLKLLAPAILLLLGFTVLIFVKQVRDPWSKTLFLWGIAIVLLGILMIHQYSVFGNVFGLRSASKLKNSFKTTIMVFSGLHWDRVHGMFIQNPAWLIGLFGLPIFFGRNRWFAVWWSLIYGSMIVPHSLYWNFYGGGLFGRFQWSSIALWVFPLGFGAEWFLRRKRAFLVLMVLFLFIYQVGFLVNSLDHQALKEDHSHLAMFGSIREYLPSFLETGEYLSHLPNYGAWFISASVLVLGCLAKR